MDVDWERLGSLAVNSISISISMGRSLGVRTHVKTLSDCYLAHRLSDRTGRGADEDDIAFLGLSNLMERAICRHTRHAQRAQVGRQGNAGDFLDHLDLGGCLDDGIGFGGVAPDQDGGAFLDVGPVALQNPPDDADGDDRLARLHGRGVRLDGRVAHASSLAGIERGIEVLGGEAALGRRGILVKADVLDGQVLPRHGPPDGDRLVDECFVLHHGDDDGFSRCQRLE